MSSSTPATIGSPRALLAAIELVSRWQAKSEADYTPLDRIVSGFFRSHHELNSGERRWITGAVYGTARLLRRQTYLLDHLERPHSAEGLIRLWQAETEADTDTYASAAIAALPGPDSPSDYLRISQSFPDEMAASLESLLGDEAGAAGEAFNRQAPTMLRVNPLRATMERIRVALPEAAPSRYSPWALELPRRVNIFDQPGYREGWYEIQDEGSQLAALISDAQPGMTVIDVAAGAGGKTLALAAMMQGKGKLAAIDSSQQRLDELVDRAKRAKAPFIDWIRVHSGQGGLWKATGQALQSLNKLYGKGDCVFVDAPCSGSGAIRRSPDAKWRQFDAEEMSELQRRLLEQGAALATPGGCLIYVTCAFEGSQNEQVVDRFLETQIGKRFLVEPARPHLESALKRAAEGCRRDAWTHPALNDMFAGPYLRTWPHRHETDAFFAARLVRRPAGKDE